MVDASTPVIAEVAVNGSTPRSVNPHVPLTPAEVAEDMLSCVAGGASIAHDHHTPMFVPDGVHPVEPYLAAWAPVLARHPDLLLYPTMAAGARGIPVETRWAHVEELARRGLGGLSLVDPGSVNVGLTSDGTVPEANPRARTRTATPTSSTWSTAAPSTAPDPASRSSTRASCGRR